MALHQLRSATIGVPDPEPVAAYYTEFGLIANGDGVFSTLDGDRQLFLKQSPSRRLLELVVGVDHRDDLTRADEALSDAGHHADVDDEQLRVVEPETGVCVVLQIAPRVTQQATTALASNGPGRIERPGARSPAVLRSDVVRPRKLGHVVVTTTNFAATSQFFVHLIGFKVSDYIDEVGAFLRCSTDHHNLLVLGAPAVYLHHTAWQVDDVDAVGRGASAMLADHPERHVWGLGRHHAGSNFFWYLRDPAGNYSEYYADLDYIPEDGAWVPESHEGHLGLYNWGPPPPPSFLHPEDLAEIVAAQRVG
jgi:catechol 2,3-dioxygenase-like lactoylglutathione lyase family enzyme